MVGASAPATVSACAAKVGSDCVGLIRVGVAGGEQSMTCFGTYPPPGA